jgi:hypothetical protein
MKSPMNYISLLPPFLFVPSLFPYTSLNWHIISYTFLKSSL